MCVKRDLFSMILHYNRTRISRNVIFFENQHFFHMPYVPFLLLWSSPPLSNGSQIFLKSVLTLNQVWCIQDDPTNSPFQCLTRYLILTCTGISQLQHLQSLWYTALLECLYPCIGMCFLWQFYFSSYYCIVQFCYSHMLLTCCQA